MNREEGKHIDGEGGWTHGQEWQTHRWGEQTHGQGGRVDL